MRGTKSHLLGFGKKVVGVAVQHQPAEYLHRHQFFGNQFGRVENVEAELPGLRFGEHLHAKLPFGEGARLDTIP